MMTFWRSRQLYFFFFLIFFLNVSPSFAQVGPIITSDCQIAWQANSEDDLVGYRLYSETSPGIYGVPTSILAPVTSTTCSFLNIKTNGQYYIAISAYDTTGNESLISYSVPFYLQLPIAPTVIVSIAKSGTGSGKVTSSPAGITCGAVCSHEFPPSAIVTLSAKAATGSVFRGWIGGGCSGAGTCTVTATNLVTAVFDVRRRR
jgi:Divergent InlB B-repeat domain